MPFYRVHLGTPATGWIATVSADVGTRVKAGDLLAEIRAPELVAARDARAEEARAAKQEVVAAASMLKSAEALTNAAQSEFGRISKLSNTGTETREVPVTLAAVDGKTAILSAGPAYGEKVITP